MGRDVLSGEDADKEVVVPANDERCGDENLKMFSILLSILFVYSLFF
jgi:hypothetical protein